MTKGRGARDEGPDLDLFREAVRDVVPIKAPNRVQPFRAPAAPIPLKRNEDERAVLAELARLASPDDDIEFEDDGMFLRPGLPRVPPDGRELDPLRAIGAVARLRHPDWRLFRPPRARAGRRADALRIPRGRRHGQHVEPAAGFQAEDMLQKLARLKLPRLDPACAKITEACALTP